MQAEFGIERELQNEITLIEYENGNGDFHFHSQIEICIVNDGEIDALVNNKRRTLKSGDVSVSLSYDTHVYLPLTDSKFTVLIIPIHICEKFISSIKHKKVSDPFITDKNATERISACIRGFKSTDNEVKQIGYIYLLLGNITENLSFETSADLIETDLLSKLLLYIHENYNKDLSLASLSQIFGYSQCYISRYFKTCLNIGIIRYLNIIRLKNAIKLMQQKKHNITYCVFESGFNSLRTFYRVFNSEFHCSPNEYVKRI